MIAAVAILGVVIVALLVERTIYARTVAHDQRHLINALVARNGHDLAVIEREPPAPRLRLDEERPQVPDGL